MTSINDKMGLKRARKRLMMKLPTDRELRTQLTSAVCPACGQRGARLSKLKDRVGHFVCSWCGHTWDPEA